MNARSIIRSLLAGFLLLVLASSITPRHWLHEWVSGHEHTVCPVEGGNTTLVSKAEKSCHCDPIHFTHHFFEPTAFLSVAIKPEHESGIPISAIPSCWIQQPRYFFSLHGPPCLS